MESDRFILERPLILQVEDDFIEIPAGFITDLISIPRFFDLFIDRDNEKFMRAAIAHDFLYQNTCYYNRITSDKIFYALLRKEKVNFVACQLMYYSVRIFGAQFYNDEGCI
ncbi:MAG: DUF1353 domain-containing protein [Candidatus Nitrosocosmicus sp.]